MPDSKTQLNEKYDPAQIESSTYRVWERQGYFAPRGNGSPFSIAIPPPNVTGTLHIGHAFQHTLIDVLIRFHRMDGHRTLWQTGTDHAGISTQMVVTEQLAAEGKSLADVGRDAFIDRVWKWRQESGGTITKQMRRMGSSVDWSTERFTMDEGFAKAVLEVFVRLYEEGLIYRGQRLVNWDPTLQTALSDLEVVTEEEDGHLWHIRYPLDRNMTTDDGKPYVVVATTRPETMFGDTAVAVHPNDDRYRSLIGSDAVLPLVGRKLRIIADEHVDPEFGTGCLKITPAHDFDDNDIGQRHSLDFVNVLNADASMNENVPEPYEGLDRLDARKRVVTDLEEEGLLDSVSPYRVQIPRGERSGAIVEPWLTDQWFVRVEPLAKQAIAVVEQGEITFHPRRWTNVYFSWMHDTRDWCISRQQWWGHRIPAWYDDQGNIFVGRSEREARETGGVDDAVPLRQDPDVLDTWFSSALWTFATLGWPDDTPALQTFHPTDVMVTGHDIIFFWVARMIMMTLHFTGEVPFRDVFVHSLVRDAEGQKMSKSRGNGLDPIDLIDGVDIESLVAKRTSNLPQPRMAERIEKATRRDYPNGIRAYGTDALRFTFCSLASPGNNCNFDTRRVEGNHFFCNKLWNATRFVLANTVDQPIDGAREFSVADRWIQSRLYRLITDCRRAIATYRFDLYAAQTYEFIWHEFCDWYLELTKPLLFAEDTSAERSQGIRSTLIGVLDATLRLTHPVMPIVTEALWQELKPLTGRSSETIMLDAFPDESEFSVDEEAEADIGWLKDVATSIRTIRSERQTPPRQKVEIMFQGGDETDRRRSEVNVQYLTHLTRAASVTWLEEDDALPHSSIALVNDLKIAVPFSSEREIESERQRIAREIDRLSKDMSFVDKKLSNPRFVQNAPADIVSREREKQSSLTRQMQSMRDQLDALA